MSLKISRKATSTIPKSTKPSLIIGWIYKSGEWQCCGDGCEYREYPISASHAYAISHGASEIVDHINYFLSFYLIRKCLSSTYENKRVSTVMSKLVDFLNQKDIIDAKKKKEIKAQIRQCNAVDGDKIIEALLKLKKENYWKSLSAEEGFEAENHGEDSSNAFSRSVDAESGLSVEQVTNEGWLLQYESCGFFSGFDNDEDENGKALLRLPPPVAKLGRKGMRITCISLGQRADNGVYEPFNAEPSYNDRISLYGNVYP